MSLFRKALVGFVGLALLAAGSAGSFKPVQAADFYVFSGSKPYQMVVVELGDIQALANGNKTAALWYVTIGMLADLDVSKVEMDCTSPRFRVIAETNYAGFRPTAQQIDKTSQNSKEWSPIGKGNLFDTYRTAVCAWPNIIDGQNTVVEFPDIWTATNAAADFLWDSKMKEQEK